MPANLIDKPVRLLAAAARTTDFWLSVARHSVPVIGVWAFGWSPVNVGVFFLLESWLFISTRATIEVTFDPHYAGDSLLLNLAGGVEDRVPCACSRAWPARCSSSVSAAWCCWSRFPLWHGRPFSPRAGVSSRFSSRWRSWSSIPCSMHGRSSAGCCTARRQSGAQTTNGLQELMLYRVGALLIAFLVLMVAAGLGIGGRVSVLVIMIILVYVDTFPRRLIRYFYGPCARHSASVR